MTKISYGQLAAILVISRMFAEAMNFPTETSDFGMQCFVVSLVSKFILVLLYIPTFIFVRNNPDENLIEYIFEKNKVFGWITGILFSLTLVSVSIITVCRLEFYATSTILNEAPSALLIISTLAVCGYGIFKGLQATARVSVITLSVFVIFLVLIALSATDLMDFNYFYPAFLDSPDEFLSQVIIEISKNSELLVFPILAGFVRKDPHKSLYGYIIGIVILIEFINVMEMLILGEYRKALSFPLYMISSLADLIIVQRLDGIDVVVWIMGSIMKIIAISICLNIIAKTVLKSELAGKIAAILNLVLTGALSLYFTANKVVMVAAKSWYNTAIPVVVCGFLIPLITIIFFRSNKKDDVNKKPEKISKNGAVRRLAEGESD